MVEYDKRKKKKKGKKRHLDCGEMEYENKA